VRTEPNVSAGQSLHNLNREDIARAISIGRSVFDEWCRANNMTGEPANGVLGSAAIIGALRAMIKSLHPDLSEVDFEAKMKFLHLVPAEIFNFAGIGAAADENPNGGPEPSPMMPQPGVTGGPALGSHIGLGPVGYSTDEQSRRFQTRSRRQH
jgi:hypothetical protein